MGSNNEEDRHAEEAAAMAARYDREAPEPPDDLSVPNGFVYIHYKAFCYLAGGPEAYREADFFGFPPADWWAERLATVARGCEQLVQWHGLTPQRPQTGVGVKGFYDLAQLFHFRVVRQAAT